MKIHADNAPGNKCQASSNGLVERSAENKSTFQLHDNRPKSAVQKKQVEAMAGGSPVQKKGNNTGLPDQLKSGIENISGHSMDDVKVHYNSNRPAQLNAHAFAQGTDIHIASGQEKHLPHEAWHVVQQKQGRVKPTIQMKGNVQFNDISESEKAHKTLGAESHHPVLCENIPENVVQRQLVPALPPHAYMIDNRDPNGTQHFTVDPGGAGPNDYIDQGHYLYTYNPITRELEVRGGVANQYWDSEHQEQLTRTAYVTGGVNFSIYSRGHNRYYYHNHRYRLVPNARVAWADAGGRFIDNLDRVLTNDGARVQKHYLIGKDAERNYVLPIKQHNHFDIHHNPVFMAGLPNIFGGNMDPADADPHTTATREAGEETNFNYTSQGPSQFINHINQGGNRLHFRSGQVRPTAAHEQAALLAVAAPFTQEMNPALGQFKFKAHQINYIAGVTTDQQIRDRILQLFAIQKGVNPDHAFFTARVDGREQTPRQEFNGSHIINALVQKIKQDHTSYFNGMNDSVVPGQVAQHPNDIEYMAAFNQYNDGRQQAQNALAALHPNEPAYMEGFNDYIQGLTHVQGNAGAANPHGAYIAARNEYTQGLADARGGIAAANANRAYMDAHNEYAQGLTAARGGIAAANANYAYMMAYNQYTQGLTAARGGLAAANADRAYMTAYNEYAQGLGDASNEIAAVNVNLAYMAAHNEYAQGLADARGGIAANNANRAYVAGYNDYRGGNAGKKRR